MNTVLPLLLSAGCACAWSGVDANAQQSVEPFAGAPIMVSTDLLSGSPGPSLLLKCEGFRTTAPTSWPTPIGTGPDFDLERSLFVSPVQGLVPDLDAFSVGLDCIWSDANGVLTPVPNAWGALTFSVTSGSMFAGSAAINLESTGPGRSADVFSFVLPGSVFPPSPTAPAPRRRTQRAADSAELGFDGAATPELDALDHFAPLWQMDPGGLSNFLAPNPTVYFSVSAATVPLVPASWWSNPTDASGATILQTTWLPSTMSWSTPSTFKSWSELGLMANDDVDALAFDCAKQLALFSTTRNDRRYQLRIVDCSTDTGDSCPYVDAAGDLVAEEVGIQSDDDEIDAVCAIDPPVRLGQPGGGAGASNPISRAMSFAVGDDPPLVFPGVPRTLEATAFLMCETSAVASGCPLGTQAYRVLGLGWPGSGTQGPGAIAAFITNSCPPVALSGTIVRPLSGFAGDPFEFTFCVPDALRLMPSAFELEITWLGFEVGTGHFLQSYPNTLRL